MRAAEQWYTVVVTSDDDGALREADEASGPMTREIVKQLAASRDEFVRFVGRRVGDPEVARDIVQEVFARGIDRIETLRETDSAVAWFYRALRNATMDHHRRRKVASTALEAFAAEIGASEEPPPDVRDATCRCIGAVAETLKPEYADALRSIEIDDVPVVEFAASRGISPNNAAVRVMRARKALRARVEVACGACAAHGCVDCTCT